MGDTNTSDLSQPFLNDGQQDVVLQSDNMAPTIEAIAAHRTETDRKTRLLIITFGLMVFFALGNRIFQVLMAESMENYAFYVSLLTTFVYIPASFAYIWPMLKWGTMITPDQLKIPKRVFAYMGALDSLAGVIQTVAITVISNGTIVTLVAQTAIPVSMLLSRWLLGTRYRKSQYIGCVIVAGGLALVLIPKFVNAKPDPDAPSSTKLQLSVLAMTLASIPMCLSSIVKERTLGEQDVDAIYLNGWVAVFQFIIGIPLLYPIAAILKDPPVDKLWNNIWDGMKCGVGINTVKHAPKLGVWETFSNDVWKAMPFLADTLGLEADPNGFSPASSFMGALALQDTKIDHCSNSPYYIGLYIFFNLGYNILITLIIKYGSANLVWLAMTITVPLSSIAFALKFMPKPKKFTPYDGAGLAVVLSGLVIYRFWPEIRLKLFGKTAEDLENERIEAEQVALRQSNVNTTSPSVVASSSGALLDLESTSAMVVDDFPPARGPSSILDDAAEDVSDDVQSVSTGKKTKGKKSRK